MSEYIENENENENVEEVVEASGAVEVVEEAVEAEDIVEETAEETAEEASEEAAEEPSLDDQLFDKAQRAARLLRNRKFAMGREAEADAARASELMRALKLLELKPQMEQKEMSDLLGMRLRELDGILREAEEVGAVTRIMPEEEDMRAILVSANENAEELAASIGGKRKKLVPQLSQLDAEDIVEELAASIGGKRKKLVPQLSQLDAEDIVALASARSSSRSCPSWTPRISSRSWTSSSIR